MKKLIRKGVFETNSSSSHSISLGKEESKAFILDTIEPDRNGIITLTGGEYGWEFIKSNDALFKANYAATAFLGNEKLTKVLEQLIKSFTLCKKVVINISGDYSDENYSYIDHDSYGTCPTDTKELKDFIFNKNSWWFGGNDNSTPAIDFYDVPTYTTEGKTKVKYKYELTCIQCREIKASFKEEPTEEDIRSVFESFYPRIYLEDYDGHKSYRKGQVEVKPSFYTGGNLYAGFDYNSVITDKYVILIHDGLKQMVSKLLGKSASWKEESAKLKELSKLDQHHEKLYYEIVEL